MRQLTVDDLDRFPGYYWTPTFRALLPRGVIPIADLAFKRVDIKRAVALARRGLPACGIPEARVLQVLRKGAKP